MISTPHPECLQAHFNFSLLHFLESSSQTRRVVGAQPHPGEHLECLTPQFISHKKERVTWGRITDTNRTLDQAKTTHMSSSLYGFCADVLLPSATEGLFESALLELDPDLIHDFHDFHSDGWMFTDYYPRFIAQRELLAFVASLISSYDLEVVRQKASLGGAPRRNKPKPTLGVLGPIMRTS